MILRPSNAHRWANCSGSYALQFVYPDDEESPAAREGTAAHYWATEAMDGRVHPIGHLAPNGHPIDLEMVEGGQLMMEYLYGLIGSASGSWRLLIEQKGTAHGLIHHLCEGTPDFAFIDYQNHRIVVPDYKYGHRDVDPRGNEQGLCYIATVIEGLEFTREDVKGWEIIFAIVQPRQFRDEKVREWRMLGWQAWDAIEALSAKAEAAVTPDAPTMTGPWCRDCSAAHGCPAALTLGAEIVDLSTSSTPQELSETGLSVMLTKMRTATKRLEALTTALEEIALSKIRTGHPVPGWTIGHGDAREKWTTPAAEVFAMGDLMGVELRKPQEPITPPQARKAGVDASVISAYSEKPRGAAKLTPVDQSTAAKVFG